MGDSHISKLSEVPKGKLSINDAIIFLEDITGLTGSEILQRVPFFDITDPPNPLLQIEFGSRQTNGQNFITIGCFVGKAKIGPEIIVVFSEASYLYIPKKRYAKVIVTEEEIQEFIKLFSKGFNLEPHNIKRLNELGMLFNGNLTREEVADFSKLDGTSYYELTVDEQIRKNKLNFISRTGDRETAQRIAELEEKVNKHKRSLTDEELLEYQHLPFRHCTDSMERIF